MINAREARKIVDDSMSVVKPVLDELDLAIQNQAEAGATELICTQEGLFETIPVGEESGYPIPELVEKIGSVLGSFGYKTVYKAVGKPYTLPSERNEDGTGGTEYRRWALVINW